MSIKNNFYLFIFIIFITSCSNVDEEYINLVQYLDEKVKSIKKDDFENNTYIAQNAINKINAFINKYNDSKYIQELEKCKLHWGIFLNNQQESFFNAKRDINNKIIYTILEEVKKRDRYKNMIVNFINRINRETYTENNYLIIKDKYVLALLFDKRSSIEVNAKVVAKVVNNNVVIDSLKITEGG